MNNISYHNAFYAALRNRFKTLFTRYKKLTIADGGELRNDSLSLAYMKWVQTERLDKDIRFAWFGEAGIKTRTSGINNFITKAYGLPNKSDVKINAVQTTSTSQPYLSGNIAPTEKYALKNPNGGSNYLTHPPISFGATEAFTLKYLVKWNGDSKITAGLHQGGAYFTELNLRFNYTNRLALYTSPGGTLYFSEFDTAKLIGKIAFIVITTDGNGIYKLFINGVLVHTVINIGKSYSFQSLISQTAPNMASCSIYKYSILAGLQSAQQITQEYNLIRNFIPEVESVQIGTQTWATSNCEMAATPQGTIIPEMQLATNTERVVNGNFESGLIGTLTSADEVSSWTLNSTNPISGTKDGLLQVTTIGTNSSRPRLTLDITALSSLAKYIKVTFNYKVNSGTVSFVGVYSGSGQYVGNTSLSGSGTYVVYIPYVFTAGQYLSFNGTKLFSIQIDNISVQEIGWSGSQELYDGIYAQTTGTTEQKTYASLKAAAMWCHYNNDVALGAVYGKILNGYAIKLLAMDLTYYNAANPAALWGWRPNTNADYNTLYTYLGGNDGIALKHNGTTYWASPNNATNSSGLTLLPAGYRDVEGIFRGINTDAVMITVEDFEDNPKIGGSVRLIKT